MFNKIFSKKNIVILLLISITLNIITISAYLYKEKKYTEKELFSEISDIISSSDNTIQVLSFYKEQLKLETISNNDYSAQLKELSDIHATLIKLIEDKDYGDLNELKNTTLLFLNERKKIFDNLKSAIDLDSTNYYNVASEAEQKANQLLSQINKQIKK